MCDVSLSGVLVEPEEIAAVLIATDGQLGSRLPTVDELGMFEQLLRQIAATLEPAGPWLSALEDRPTLASLPAASEVLRLVSEAGWIAKEAERVAAAARAFREGLEHAHDDRPAGGVEQAA